jgi:riboflavin synthase
LFTGLIEEKGVVVSMDSIDWTQLDSVNLVVAGSLVSQDAEIGDSIAINGCCLTVVSIGGEKADELTFQAGSETLSRTNLGQLKPGSPVNLERSLAVGQRMGGHYVAGHVDGLGVVNERVDDDQWSTFWFSVPESLTVQMASKGSVAIDGISLTLVDVERERFSVALIPHTLAVTTLGRRNVGDEVNIETDLLAKYVQQQLNRK